MSYSQWGNMLTLQAAHGNPVLRPFVEIQVLRDLLHKTLAFLWMHSQRSSALFTAYKILLHTAQETGVLNEEQPVNRSFESQRDVTMS
jgi:hypothetical protein